MKKSLLFFSVFMTFLCLSLQAQNPGAAGNLQNRKLSLEEAKLRYHKNFIRNSPDKTIDPRGIVFEEHFDGADIPANWTALAFGWDFIYVYDNAINLFKQSAGNDPIILSTPGINISKVSKMDFEMISLPQNDGIAVIQVGTMSDPNDPATFVLLEEFIPVKYEWSKFSIVLKAITDSTHMAFKLIGLPWDFITIDNVVMYDDEVTDKSPMNVTNLQVITGNSGEMAANFKWTNPSQQKDGQNLEKLESIQIISEGEVLYTVNDPVIGGQQEVSFDVPNAGFYKFNVIPYNEYGKGFIAQSKTLWIGQDLPGAPKNSALVKTGNEAKLTWSPPVSGAHGFYFDGKIDKYEIIRADGVNYFVPGTDTSFSETITVPGTFNYSIVPYNVSGIGTPAFSNAAQYLMDGYLVYEDFWVDPIKEGFWSSNEENWKKNATNAAGGDKGELTFYFWPDFNGLSRVLSPVINTTGLNSLSIEFLKTTGLFTSNPYKLKIETTSDGGKTWNHVFTWNVTKSSPPEFILKAIHNSDVGKENFQFAFTFEGNSKDIGIISIDNVRLYSGNAINLVYVSNNLPKIEEPNQVITPKVKIENIGSDVTPYEAIFSLFNGPTEVYRSVKSGDIEIGVIDSVVFDNWTTIEGEYKALVQIKCNGDADTLNNSADFEMNVYGLMDRQMILIEEGTGTWCYYCPGAAMGIDDLLTQGYKVAAIAYHSGDIYETTEGRAKLEKYAITGFPSVYFDGPAREVIGAENNVSSIDVFKPIVEYRMKTKTPLKLQFSDMKYDNTNRTLTGNVIVTSLSPINNTRLRLYSVITESGIKEEWQGQNELNFVERKMFPSSEGLPLELTTKEDQILVNISIDNTWNENNCELIIFVQDTLTKEVFATNLYDIENTSSVYDNELDALISVYPNPATESCFVNISKTDSQKMIVKLYNPTGQEIDVINYNSTDKRSNEIKIDFSNQPAGLYLLTINDGKNTTTKKIYHTSN